MSSVQISDDDDSFELIDAIQTHEFSESDSNTILLSESDSNTILLSSDNELDYELPPVDLAAKKSAVIKKLFPNTAPQGSKQDAVKSRPAEGSQVQILPNVSTIPEPKKPGINMPIGGVTVNFPLKPYGSQIALIAKMMTAMKEGKNCLLESPTGSGKTLALLCGALAWQDHERNIIAQSKAKDYFSYHPELNEVNGAAEYIRTPSNDTTPVKLFEKSVFGEKSIYDRPCQEFGEGNSKRQEPMSDHDTSQDSPYKNEVTIHKRRRIGELGECSTNNSPTYTPNKTPTKESMATPEKTYEQVETPTHLRKLANLIDNLRLRTSMHIDCSLPIIYYGARTHKQLQQVIKEFGRTAYCGDVKMSLLASREYSCIREFDKQLWGTKNDMCRGCTKKIRPADSSKPLPREQTNCVYYDNKQAMSLDKLPPAFDLEDLVSVGHENKTRVDFSNFTFPENKTERHITFDLDFEDLVSKIRPADSSKPLPKEQTNCVFYDNRQAMNHDKLPSAFDLEDLVSVGHEIKACPFYASKQMVKFSNIVFCPYNYLIEPSIRSSMQIDLQNNIVIIDEAHNIEDICRDAATFTFHRNQFVECIKELEYVCSLRFANSNKEILPYLDHLLETVKIWDQWFQHQKPLIDSKPVTSNEAVHVWEVEHFITTLNNHNIGENSYAAFNASASEFTQRFRDQPDTLYGVTQATATLVDNLNTVLSYLLKYDGIYKYDFKPVLIRTISSELSEANSWRSSQFNKSIDKETLSLRLICMNSAVVFDGLKKARCIMLASGTLTPLHSLHSELATEFPLQVSPNHVIPSDRVWIGTLTTCPDGTPLQCTSKGTDQPALQDAIGEAVLWVCQVTPHGVLCFLPSYMLMNKLYKRWEETGLWRKLNELKNVFMESRNVRDHNEVMEDYYETVSSNKGALLFAVYRGKVSEGMDFKDHQARAVITVGIPYPNTFDMAVKEKMKYNDRFEKNKKLLTSREWLRVQAYRALNQAVGRCVRHRGDWGAVLLVDSRFANPYYTEHLSKWVRNFLGNNHHTFESLVNSANSLESFMQNMTIRQNEDGA